MKIYFKFSIATAVAIMYMMPNLAFAEISGIDINNAIKNDGEIIFAGSNGSGSNNVVIKDENSLDTDAEYIGGFANNGDANSNSISVHNSKIETVMGGYSVNGSANENSVTLENLDLSFSSYGEFVGGNAAESKNGNANSNKITINNVEIPNGNDDIIGGVSQTSANSNVVIISNSNTGEIGISGGMALGESDLKTANSNKVIIKNSTISDAWGGSGINEFENYKEDDEENFLGTADNNIVEIENSIVKQGISAGGGYNANGNKIIMTSTTVQGEGIIAGRANGGNANQNEIILNDSKVKSVYGGASMDGEVSGNKITINGGSYTNIYGGFGGGFDDGGKASKITNNTINFNEGEINGDLMSVSGEFDSKSANTLNIDASKGARTAGSVANFDNINFANFKNSKDSTNAALKVSKIDLSGANIDYGDISSLENATYYLISSSNAITGFDEAWAISDKNVVVTETTYSSSQFQRGLSSDSKNLTLSISNTGEQSYGKTLGDNDIEKEALAKAEIITLKSNENLGENNINLAQKNDFKINAKGTKNIGNVEVGKSVTLNFDGVENVKKIQTGEKSNLQIKNSKEIKDINAKGADKVNLKASEFANLQIQNANEVSISGSNSVGNISADKTKEIVIVDSTLSEKNKITLGENSVLTIINSSNLGNISNLDSDLIVDNSTFSSKNDGSVKVKNFTLKNNTQKITLDSMEVENLNLELPNSVKDGDTIIEIVGDKDTDISNTSVSVKLDNPKLTDGNVVHLVTSTKANLLGNPKSTSVDMGLLNAKGEIIKADNKNLDLNIPSDSVTTEDSAKILLETALTQSIAINEAGNLLSDTMDKIQNSTDKETSVFVNLSGFDKRYKTGSYIDQNGFNANFGVAHSVANMAGAFTYGIFAETGIGSYKSKLDSGTNAKGDTKFIGAGLFAKQNFGSGLYLEASARGGSVETDFKGDIDGNSYDFELNSKYFGAHTGIGVKLALGSKNMLDFYTKYLYSYVDGDEIDLSGTTLKTKSSSSNRIRVGLRDDIAINEESRVYVGIAYGHEFSGKARGDLIFGSLSDEIASPKLKGGSGIGEFGYVYEANSIKFEIGAKGYIGKEQGYSGNLGIAFKF